MTSRDLPRPLRPIQIGVKLQIWLEIAVQEIFAVQEILIFAVQEILLIFAVQEILEFAVQEILEFRRFAKKKVGF